MLDTKDFSFFEEQNGFDFKGFLIKTASYWKWFLVSWAIAFTIAYQTNIRKEKIYSLETTISVKEESNPFFTANTSLVFNWGGASDQVQAVASTLKSRSHNELVVDSLQFYIDYLQDSKYNIVDAYGQVPFFVNINKQRGQLAGKLIEIKFLNANTYQVSINFESDQASTIRYTDNSYSNTAVEPTTFQRNYKIGQLVDLPFLNWKLELGPAPGNYTGKKFYVKFNDFDGTVARYQGINVVVDAAGSSILKLSLQGTNKARIVKYLNTTVEVLKKSQLDAKNQFATNTINFIKAQMEMMEGKMSDDAKSLRDFTAGKDVSLIEEGGSSLSERQTQLDIQRDAIGRKINYYDELNSYLRRNTDYSKLPAPTVAGIEDPNIVSGVSNLIALSIQRSQMKYSVKSEKLFQDFDMRMDAIKNVLLENIRSAKSSLQYELNQVNANIGAGDRLIKKLPEEQQQLIQIKRKAELTSNIYNTFLEKLSEAGMVKAANVSDIRFIDPAKDVGGGLVGPKTGVNYVLALFLGFILPLLVVFGIFFVNNSIQNTEDIAKLTAIPLIGVIGKKQIDGNLAVFEKPKSALAESFRAIRSSLQFLYKKQNIGGSRTLMLTSSISGEGKTFCSINIATVFAMSEKRTIIVGLDLRKPKIFEDFNLSNDIGAVNYLIGENSLDEVIQHTHIPFLDVILSGPVPPNPSELIMADTMKELMADLKSRYDYIIVDTPPVGLVSDALELSPLSDVILYVVRQNFTKKDMITLLNNRNKRGELSNVSIILNGFESKAKYGYGYGYNYGYGYGYGNYSSGYHDDDRPNTIMGRLTQFLNFGRLFRKGKKK